MAGLPPGQRESTVFYRFGLTPFAERFPRDSENQSLRVSGAVAQVLQLDDSLEGLPRVEQVSDFHCVTTWSVRGLTWEGVRFRDFYSEVIVPGARPEDEATLVSLKAQDGARTGMLLQDLLDPSVILADRLNGEPLSVDHGAPLRLVAPKHYGYKSVKHLCELSFAPPDGGYRVSAFKFMDHPRARVEFEERGRGVPGFLLRFLYRPLIKGTAQRFANASAKRKKSTASGDAAQRSARVDG